MWQSRVGGAIELIMDATGRFQQCPEELDTMNRSVWTGAVLHRYGYGMPSIVAGYLLELFLKRRIQENVIRNYFGEQVVVLLTQSRSANVLQPQTQAVCMIHVAYAVVCVGNCREYSEDVCNKAESWLANARDNDACRDQPIVAKLEQKLERARALQPQSA